LLPYVFSALFYQSFGRAVLQHIEVRYAKHWLTIKIDNDSFIRIKLFNPQSL